MYFVFISFLVKDQEEFGIFGRTGTQDEWEHFGEIGNFQKNEHFTETVNSFQTVDYIETMSNADKLEVRAKKHEQAALDARHKAELAREKKEKKLAEKEAKTKKKKVVNLRKGHTGEPQDDDKSLRVGATNATFYPIYQQTMSRLSIEFIIRMKEERDSSIYSQYIEKVIQHVGAVDTSV